MVAEYFMPAASRYERLTVIMVGPSLLKKEAAVSKNVMISFRGAKNSMFRKSSISQIFLPSTPQSGGSKLVDTLYAGWSLMFFTVMNRSPSSNMKSTITSGLSPSAVFAAAAFAGMFVSSFPPL